MIASTKTKIGWIKSTNLLAGLILFFSSFLFFYDTFTERVILSERDLGPYFIPPRFFWVESIKQGGFPLWNPCQFSGHPFFANPQHAVLYPLNGLFLLLPFDVAFNTIIILHFFLGGLFTYFLLKDLDANTTGALISGLIFMLSGYLLSVHSLLNCLLSVIWTPLIVMFFRRSILHTGFKNEMLTAVFMTFSFLGGGLEIVYGNFMVLLLMVIFSPFTEDVFVGDKPRRYKFFSRVPIYWRGKEFLLKGSRSLFIVSAIFLLLSAIQLIPFLELWTHSIRGKGISYEEATIWSFAPKDVLLFFLPDAYGYFLDMKRYWVTQCWLKTLYTGGLPFILSSFFFLSGKWRFRQRAAAPACPVPARFGACRQAGKGPPYGFSSYGTSRKFYLALILLSLFLSLGQYNPLYPFVHKYVPFFNGIRYPVKFLYIFILVLSMTAGLGFQRLIESSGEGGTKRLKNLVILSSLASGLLLISLILGHKEIEHFLRLKGMDLPHFNSLSVNLFHAKRFLFYLTLFFLLLRIGFEVKWKVWTKVLLILFLATDLFGNMGFYGKEKTSDYFQKTKISEIVSSDQEPFRVFSTGKTISMESPVLIPDASPLNVFKEKHLPTMNLLHRLHDLWGIDVVRLKRVDVLYNTLVGAPSITSTNLLDLYGVKYVVSATRLDEDRRLELIYARIEGLEGRKEDLIKGNTIKLYKRKEVFPRAWLVKDFEVMNPNEILLRLKGRDLDPNKEVFLEETPVPINPKSKIQNPKSFSRPPNKVEIISESNNRLLLRVRDARNAFLVLSDTYFPGWKAYVDGKEEKIYRANYNFRAVPLALGDHEVEFIYRPMSFTSGCVITGLTVIGCIGIGLMRRRAHRAAPEGDPIGF